MVLSLTTRRLRITPHCVRQYINGPNVWMANSAVVKSTRMLVSDFEDILPNSHFRPPITATGKDASRRDLNESDQT